MSTKRRSRCTTSLFRLVTSSRALTNSLVQLFRSQTKNHLRWAFNWYNICSFTAGPLQPGWIRCTMGSLMSWTILEMEEINVRTAAEWWVSLPPLPHVDAFLVLGFLGSAAFSWDIWCTYYLIHPNVQVWGLKENCITHLRISSKNSNDWTCMLRQN